MHSLPNDNGIMIKAISHNTNSLRILMEIELLLGTKVFFVPLPLKIKLSNKKLTRKSDSLLPEFEGN